MKSVLILGVGGTGSRAANMLQKKIDKMGKASDVNIVSIVVLIGVAVILAILFKDAIGDLLTSLLQTIQGNASGTAKDTLTPVELPS